MTACPPLAIQMSGSGRNRQHLGTPSYILVKTEMAVTHKGACKWLERILYLVSYILLLKIKRNVVF